MIKHLTFKTDFYGYGQQHEMFMVDPADVELFEAKDYGDLKWYLKVRDVEYEICPTLNGFNGDPAVTAARTKAESWITDIRRQILEGVEAMATLPPQPQPRTETEAPDVQ